MNKDDVLNSWMNWVKGANPQMVLNSLAKMWRRIESAGPLRRFTWKIRLAWGLVRDTVSGEYRELSKADMLLIVAALAYLVLVVDIVPDFIPVMGLLDDCVVLSWLFGRFAKELERYEAFLRDKSRPIEAEFVEEADVAGEFDNLSHGE